jgi:sec-independent protein translocase protein TatA
MNTVEAGLIGLNEGLVIVLILLVLFGGKKIPELMKGLGKGVKEFKDGMNGTDKDSNITSLSKEK